MRSSRSSNSFNSWSRDGRKSEGFKKFVNLSVIESQKQRNDRKRLSSVSNYEDSRLKDKGVRWRKKDWRTNARST